MGRGVLCLEECVVEALRCLFATRAANTFKVLISEEWWDITFTKPPLTLAVLLHCEDTVECEETTNVESEITTSKGWVSSIGLWVELQVVTVGETLWLTAVEVNCVDISFRVETREVDHFLDDVDVGVARDLEWELSAKVADWGSWDWVVWMVGHRVYDLKKK